MEKWKQRMGIVFGKERCHVSAVFRLYARVAGVHARQLSTAMRNLKQPCVKDEEIEAIIARANTDQEQLESLRDAWYKNEFLFWEYYLDKAEKE